MVKYTIGYIEHDVNVFNDYLGPSIANLRGDFEIITTTSENFPAKNYNDIINRATSPYIILTHQDITFSPDLLEKIDLTINELKNNFGLLGLVGVDNERNYLWSSTDKINELDTADGCFVVIKKNAPIKFDEENFGEYHLYVEDYCARMKRELGQSIYTISIPGNEVHPTTKYKDIKDGSFLNHHSVTCHARGTTWGDYWEFRRLLGNKYNGIQTT
jgi:hypothetical protein